MIPNKDYCPPEIVESLKRYINEGIIPGSFLEAVLCNNLKEAVGQADHLNLEVLPHIVAWLYNEAPYRCWGSPEVVIAWSAERKREQ